MAEKFYEKFQKKNTVAKAKNERKAYNRERNEYFEKKREGRLFSDNNGSRGAGSENVKRGSGYGAARGDASRLASAGNGGRGGAENANRGAARGAGGAFTGGKTDASVCKTEKLFLLERLPRDARDVLENFDNIVQGVRPLNSRQFVQLPKDIRALSHLLTDERENRRAGYMNANEELSAYVRYFTWWNLVRLTRVFASLGDSEGDGSHGGSSKGGSAKDSSGQGSTDSSCFNLKDGDYCLDIGSGPLTAVTALWLSRPELREKKLTWYCLDLSSSTMALGEDLYLSVASKTPPKNPDSLPHWNIIRVKGECGTEIRNKVSLIVAANMFNELGQKVQGSDAIAELADSQLAQLKKYAVADRCGIFIAEPGMPQAAHFVSLMRDRFISEGFNVTSPCPHADSCPMSGYHARYGGSTKWCNFDFSTEDAPSRLLKLSKDAGIPKERAVISFVFAATAHDSAHRHAKSSATAAGALPVRIASDAIRLPGNRTGFYACSEKGLLLVVNSSGKKIESGDLLELEIKNPEVFGSEIKRDKKSGAIELTV